MASQQRDKGRRRGLAGVINEDALGSEKRKNGKRKKLVYHGDKTNSEGWRGLIKRVSLLT